MKRKELFRTLKFVLFSASAAIIQLVSFALFFEVLRLPEWLSYLLALILSVLWNFTLNRRFTFQSASNIPKAMALVFLYYVVFTPLSTLLEHHLTDTLGWNAYLATIINMVINLVTEFLYQRFVVFRKSIDTNKRAEK